MRHPFETSHVQKLFEKKQWLSSVRKFQMFENFRCSDSANFQLQTVTVGIKRSIKLSHCHAAVTVAPPWPSEAIRCWSLVQRHRRPIHCSLSQYCVEWKTSKEVENHSPTGNKA